MELERLKGALGVILEIGVARGLTTRFMAEHIKQSGSGDRIIAIDTFSSFVESDIAYEASARGKQASEFDAFNYNDFAAWSRNFEEFPFVKPMQSDCALVDYASLAPVKLAFLDVDLYLPTKKVLPKLYQALIPGGVILIDDVKDGGSYDGAYQAYMEYCSETGAPPVVIGNRCGVIRKP